MAPCSISWNQSLCNLYIILETRIESNLAMLEHFKALYLMHCPIALDQCYKYAPCVRTTK